MALTGEDAAGAAVGGALIYAGTKAGFAATAAASAAAAQTGASIGFLSQAAVFLNAFQTPVSYTHLTLPTTPYV